MTTATRIDYAVLRRRPLARDAATTAYRLLNAEGDSVPNLTIDRYGPVAIVSAYDDLVFTGPRREEVVAALMVVPGVTAIYAKIRPKSASRLSSRETIALAPSSPVWGETCDDVVVKEHGLSYLIRPGKGLSAGLFLDMREMRERVRTMSPHKNVLNLFAYTCAFGVAATAGGAARVLNLDAAKPALQWGQENYALNGFEANPYDFVFGDVFDWLARVAKRGTTFDLVIADPPSFSTVSGSRFAASADYGALATACARVVAPGGLLLCCTNEAKLPSALFRQNCLDGVATAGRDARILHEGGAPAMDFPTPPRQEGHLKLLLFVLD